MECVECDEWLDYWLGFAHLNVRYPPAKALRRRFYVNTYACVCTYNPAPTPPPRAHTLSPALAILHAHTHPFYATRPQGAEGGDDAIAAVSWDMAMEEVNAEQVAALTSEESPEERAKREAEVAAAKAKLEEAQKAAEEARLKAEAEVAAKLAEFEERQKAAAQEAEKRAAKLAAESAGKSKRAQEEAERRIQVSFVQIGDLVCVCLITPARVVVI